MFYRLVRPNWGDKEHKDFIREIKGYPIYEGLFSQEYINQKNEEGYNIYFLPNHPSTNVYNKEKKFLNGKDIDTFNYIFADMDLKDKVYKDKEEFLEKVKHFPIAPSLCVTSGHGVHVYWRIDNLTREHYGILQFGLINYFKTDDSVWTVLQLMRVPGSLNTKECDNFIRSEIVSELSSNKSYKIEDLPKELFNITQTQVQKLQKHFDKLDGKASVFLAEDIDASQLPDKFIDLMYENERIYQLFTNPKEYYGDKSAADMVLANILYKLEYSKKETYIILCNTKKSLEKGYGGPRYAAHTLDKVYSDKSVHNFKTVGQRFREGEKAISGTPVNGPFFFDCLVNKWLKKQVLGIIGGSGIGKTSVALKIIKEMIENSPNNDDVFIFFSLEMPELDIMEKWQLLVGQDSPLADRLFVIGNEDEDGEPRNIGLQEIYEFAIEIKKCTGKDIGAIMVDHLHIIRQTIDITKKYTFGAEQNSFKGNSKIQPIDLRILCTELKTVAKRLDTFLIVLSQTTKAKGQGDIPIDKDGAYGISQFENIVDYMITIWQPLMRVQDLTSKYFLAWQYAKIRKKHKNDPLQTHQPKILMYCMDSGNLTPPNEDEMQEFYDLLPQAKAARENAIKKEVSVYSGSIDLNTVNKTITSMIKQEKEDNVSNL